MPTSAILLYRHGHEYPAHSSRPHVSAKKKLRICDRVTNARYGLAGATPLSPYKLHSSSISLTHPGPNMYVFYFMPRKQTLSRIRFANSFLQFRLTGNTTHFWLKNGSSK
jgi:hypothetical protein